MLMRFDPFGGLDRITEELTSSARRAPRPFAMDAFRRGDEVVLLFDLPGRRPSCAGSTTVTNGARPSSGSAPRLEPLTAAFV
jgi:hypothetical protein